MSWLISAPNVWPTASNNAGRKRLPPAKTLQRIAACTRVGSSVSLGIKRSSSLSTGARQEARNSRASDAIGVLTTEDRSEELRSSFVRHVTFGFKRSHGGP